MSEVMAALYRGERDRAEELAQDAELDIYEAASLGRVERVRKLLADDPALALSRSSDGFTPLHYAAFFGTAETAAALLEYGADPTAVAENEMRVQPLHSAAAVEATATARLLLDAGADPNARQEGGFRAIDAAVQSGNDELYALLVERGAEAPPSSE